MMPSVRAVVRARRGWVVLASVIAAASAATVRGADGTEAADDALPAAIAKLKEANGTVIALGAAEGLEGYLVRTPSGEPYAAYVTPTGALVVGMLLGAEGDNVTRRQLEDAERAGKLGTLKAPAGASPGPAPAPDPAARMARLVQETKDAAGFWIGDRGPAIHVFADPTCPYSVQHVEALARAADAGRLKAHVIPVGLLGANAAQRAIEIAGAPQPARAWSGAFTGAVNREAGAARIEANHRVHRGWGVRGVPFSVWEGPQEVRVKYGSGDPAVYASDVVR